MSSAGAGDDQVTVEGDQDQVDGGGGNDLLLSTDATGAATLRGGDGDDQILGTRHADRLFGGGGQDTLRGDAGADGLSGGDGTDTVSYADHDQRVVVTVGGGAGDGAAGEGDDVAGDVERVDGTTDDDLLVAGPAGTVLNGSDGDDRLSASTGSDVLLGAAGRDVLDAGPQGGPTVFDGGADVDELTYAQRTSATTIDVSSRQSNSGAAGEGDRIADAIENVVGGTAGDLVIGAIGTAHRVAAGGGDDTIRVDDLSPQAPDAGADSVRCDAGRDTVVADSFDSIAVACERVTVGSYLRRPEMIFATRTADRVVVAKNAMRSTVRVGCDAQTAGYCATTVLLRDPGKKNRNFARRVIRIQAGKTVTVRVPTIDRRRARTLAKRKSVLVVVAARDEFGKGSIAKRTVKIKRG
ncbi:calcium-binding protein [Patulibacter americanus]|uniref:calcium-binding protein n=1 Tax=Patulibacter americanus TaxID=588672 RepID=UPI000418149F|nr:calcium-binding protein [Patulibacter americanus]